MANIVIDTSLNEWLGLPDGYQLDKIEAFKLFAYFQKLIPIESPIDSNRLEYYVDKHGNFVENPKKKQDFVVKAIFDNMEKIDQFSVLSYIQYYEDTKGFTSFD